MAKKFLDDSGLKTLIKKMQGTYAQNFQSTASSDANAGKFTFETFDTDTKTATTHTVDTNANKVVVESGTSTGGNGTIKVTTNGTVSNPKVYGLKSAAYNETSAFATKAQGDKADAAMPKSGGTFTGAVTLNADPTADLGAATKHYVDSKIAAADAMVYRGTVGTGGSKETLPTSGVVVGDTYKACSKITTPVTAEIGDLIIAQKVSGTTITWDVVPSGNDIVGVTAGAGLSGGGTSGTVTLSHSNSVTPVTTAGLLKVKYDAQGHITGSSAVAQSDITGLGVISNAIVTNAADSTTATASTANSFINFLSNTTKKFGFAIKGGTGITVANDASNNITITPTVQGVTTGNGLSLSSGKVTMAVGSTSAKGAVQVTNGNGLAIDSGVIAMSVASSSAAGAMSSADYNKLNALKPLPTDVGIYTYNVTTAGTAGAYTAMQFVTYSGTNNDIDAMWAGTYTPS